MANTNPVNRPVIPKYGAGSGLRSPLDSNDLTNEHKKTAVVNQSNFGLANQVSRLVSQVNQLRRRIISPPLKSTDTILSHPFKIYKPTNFDSFTQGITFLDSDGTPTTCNINSSVPTDFTATPPTVNPKTDAWRFWTVRSGYIENRPLYNTNGTFLTQADHVTSIFGVDAENWVWKWIMGQSSSIVDGTDGICPPRGYEFDDPTTEANANNNVLIISGAANTSGVPFLFSIWVQITLDTTTSYATFEVLGNRVSNPSSGTTGFPVSNSLIIPIGVVSFQNFDGSGNVDLGNPIIWQYQFDHIRYRFPNQSQGTFWDGISGSIMNFRGISDTNDSTLTPSDLDQQIFYTGDIVSVLSVDNGNSLWRFSGVGTNWHPYTWENPTTSDNWKQIL